MVVEEGFAADGLLRHEGADVINGDFVEGDLADVFGEFAIGGVVIVEGVLT